MTMAADMAMIIPIIALVPIDEVFDLFSGSAVEDLVDDDCVWLAASATDLIATMLDFEPASNKHCESEKLPRS